MRKSVAWAALSVSVSMFASSANAAFNSILAFGDSLSDTGNVAAATLGAIPASPPYAPGRFSNGPIWIDGLAATFGVSSPTPSLLGGTNFSVGGSRVNVANSFAGIPTPSPSFASVAGQYLSANPTIAPTTLVTVWIGSNDFLNFDSNSDPAAMASTVQTVLAGLGARGARQFLIVNVPPVTQTPALSVLPAIQKDAIDAAIRDYNARLLGVAANLSTFFPSGKVYFLDSYAAYNAAIANPAALGLSNVTTPALVGSTVAPNPSTYLWWDTVHPTATGHAFTALGAARAIPEPTALGLIALAGLGLARRRRGQR